jgi:hypothetical protein
MLQHGGLPQLLQLLKQPSPAVKDAVYGALCAAARFEVLRTALMQEQGAMRQLQGHVQQEEPGRAAQALELLVHCTQVGRLQLHLVTAAISSTAVPLHDENEDEGCDAAYAMPTCMFCVNLA